MPRTEEAIILAGGFGTRLQGVVKDVPKPLAPVRGRPFIAWLLDALAAQGMRRIVLATGYMGDRVERELGAEWKGLALEYSRESEPLGTGGAIALAAGRIRGESVLILNGDTWLTLDYAAFEDAGARAGKPLAMALAHVPDTARYGAVRILGDSVDGFVEKGSQGPGYINAGVYRMVRSMLETLPRGKRFSFEQSMLVPEVRHGHVAAYTETGAFIDIGIPEDYERASGALS